MMSNLNACHYRHVSQTRGTFSRSSNSHTKGVLAPTSNICAPTAIMWLSILVISANITREETTPLVMRTQTMTGRNGHSYNTTIVM